ncbi:MAG TPA: hypothetical protein VII95_08225 [Terriglobales bacterium]
MFDFFFQRTSYRWGTYSIAALVIFIYGAFNEIALGRAGTEVTQEALTLGAVVLVVGLISHAVVSHPKASSIPRSYGISLGFASCVVVVALLIANTHDFSLTAKDVAAQDDLMRAVYDVEHGKVQAATKATRKAETLIAAAAQSDMAVDPAFFVDATKSIAKLHNKGGDLRIEAFNLQQQLAAYRSTLGQVDVGSLSNYMHLVCSSDKQEWFPPTKSFIVTGAIVEGCKQHIDELQWHDVIFVNSRIIYRGGPLRFDNVTFVNCTFSVERNDDGFKLLQYATTPDGLLEIVSKTSG